MNKTNEHASCPNCKTSLEIKSVIPIRTMASVLGECPKCKREYGWMKTIK